MAGEVDICYNNPMQSQKGFTLVELLVTISIFVILTGIVLFNQGKFNGSILLTNLAYDTALTIRQAQTYGVNVKEFNGSGNFVPYGVAFDMSFPKSFILFADLASDGIYYTNSNPACLSSYSSPGTDGCVSRYTIKNGNYIKDLCVDGTCGLAKLYITFVRPNPDAKIIAGPVRPTNNLAKIVLGNPDGSTRTVEVQSNGLIQIDNQ